MRVLDLIKVLSAVFIITACALAQTTEQFQFEVTTAAAGEAFSIPLSGQIGGNADNKNYDWNIDWGNGNTSHFTQLDMPTGNTSNGLTRTYSAAGTYTITITPAGETDAWLAAFGFYSGSSGANAPANKNKVTRIISPLTPLMTRTVAQITAGTAPTSEWSYTFYGCTNLTMDDGFTFSSEWDGITRVGNNFAQNMFQGCSGAAFTMSPVFNLPQGITTVGTNFANAMFYGCSGAAFTMSPVFNLPQGITTVGTYFAAYMFSQCNGAAFRVNDVFKFPLLVQSEVDRGSVFYQTFQNLGSNGTQTRTIHSIVNGNPTPTAAKSTFTGSSRFSDLSRAPTNWGGGGGATGSNPIITSLPNTTVTYNSITGSLSVWASVAPLSGTFSYQWYSNTSNSNTGGTLISGATGASFPIPTNLAAGTYYYYCIVSTSIWVSASQTTSAATVTVAKADYNMSGITFSNKTVTYDGTSQSILISGALPSGVTVTYTGNNHTTVGNYTVTANFATTNSNNYNIPASRTATLTINKAAAPTGVTHTEYVVTGYAHDYHFDLATLLPNIAGLTDVTYSPAITDNTSGVLGALSYTSGNTLMIPVNNVIGAGLSATITVTISSHNYADFTSVITVETVNKKLVEITGITMPDGVYNGNPHGFTGTLAFIRSDNDSTVTDVTFEILYESTDGGSYSSANAPTNAGEYRLTIKVPDSDPAYIGEEDFEFTIAKANGAGTVSIAGWTYGQAAKSPTISGKTAEYGSPTYTYSVQGANSYSTTVPTNAGSYTVKATFAATTNYNEHSATANFALAKATPATTAYAIPTDLTATVGQTLANVALPSGWSWETPAALVGEVGASTHKAKFTPSDVANYNVIDNIDVTVTVSSGVGISDVKKSVNGLGVIFEKNVVSDELKIVKIALPDGKDGKVISVVIYDNTGNVVFSGEGNKPWDLRNKSGRIVANGSYLVVVEAKSGGKSYWYSAKVAVKRVG